MSGPRGRSSKRAVLVAILAAAASLPACGGDDGAPIGTAGEAADAVHDLQRSFAVRNLAEMCAQMTRMAKQQVGLMAHGDINECEGDLREAMRVVGKGGWSPHGKIADVEVDDDRATVTLAPEGKPRVDVELRTAGNGWRLDSFFGTPRPLATAHTTNMPAAARRAFGSEQRKGSVKATDDVGPCPDTFGDFYPEISGGCELFVSGRVTVDIATVFGGFEFGHCDLQYRVLVDARGEAWTDPLRFDAPSNNGCADIDPCGDPSAARRWPWKGRIRSDGDGFIHRMDACLDTCVGFFVGELSTRLVRIGNGRWRVEAHPSGTSGFQITGNLKVVAPPAFELTGT